MFKSTVNSKKRPEKRDRRSASKEESISELGDSMRKQSSREKKEQMRLQKRSEINERRQKDRKEKYEKKKSDAMQEKKLLATATKAPSNDTIFRVTETEDEISDNIKPKRYSDRRREDKIKRENKIAAATGANPKPSIKCDEKFSDHFTSISVNDNKTKAKSRAREEGSSKKSGKGDNEGQKRKEEHDAFEGEEEREMTEVEKRRREEITARRDRERQERKERIKNKVGAKDIMSKGVPSWPPNFCTSVSPLRQL